jgi:hypothetical protein
VAYPGVIPKVGEYLSGWYVSDSLLNFFFISLLLAFIGRSKILRELVLLHPAPSGFQFIWLWFSLGDCVGEGGGGGEG